MYTKRLLLLLLTLVAYQQALSSETMVLGLDEYYAVIRGEQVVIAEDTATPYTGKVLHQSVEMGFLLRHELEVVDGRPHGKEFCTDVQGKVLLDRHWVDGVKDGPETWWKKGKKNKQINYEQGLRQGEETGWYEDGELRYIIQWDNDVQDGPETYWHRNGQKSYQVNWEDGKRTGRQASWYKDGQVESQSTYVDDLPYGKYVYWHENGVKSIEGNMIDGRKNGLLIKWSPNGQLVYRGCYSQGELLNPPATDLWPEDEPCPPVRE